MAPSPRAKRRKLDRRLGTPLKGIYFWGSVGRGKIYVMDTLFECLPFSDKLRAHFHSFMLWGIPLKPIGKQQGAEVPLRFCGRGIRVVLRKQEQGPVHVMVLGPHH